MVWLRRCCNGHADQQRQSESDFCYTSRQHEARQVYAWRMFLGQRDQKLLLLFDPRLILKLQDSRCEELCGPILQLQHKWLRKVFPNDPYLISSPYGESTVPRSTSAFLTRGMLRFCLIRQLCWILQDPWAGDWKAGEHVSSWKPVRSLIHSVEEVFCDFFVQEVWYLPETAKERKTLEPRWLPLKILPTFF